MAVDPYAAALMAFGGGLSSAAGPSAAPVGLGAALGRGARSGLAGYLDAIDREDQSREREMAAMGQMANLQQLAEQRGQERKRQAGLASLVAAAPEELRPYAQAMPDVFARSMMTKAMEPAPAAAAGASEAASGGGLASMLGMEPTTSTANAMQEAMLLMRADPTMTWGDAIRRATGNAPEPVAVGNRLLMPAQEGGYTDITPALGAPAPAIEHTTGIGLGEAVDKGVGVVSGARTAVGRTLGQFWTGAASPRTEQGRAKLSSVAQQVREVAALSGRPTNWQLERLAPMLTEPTMWDSPASAQGRFSELRYYLAEHHNNLLAALQDPALEGKARAEAGIKRRQTESLISDIDGLLKAGPPSAPTTRAPSGVPIRDESAPAYGAPTAVPGGLTKGADGVWRLSE